MDNHMRIHVNADGAVEFSVALSGAVDPAVVAGMVAAVRAGIVAAPPAAPRPPPDAPAEPTSDPDSARAPPPRDRTPSPLVVSAAPALSVRQLAAEFDARPHAPPPNPYADFLPAREVSSSPALWLTAARPAPPLGPDADSDAPRSAPNRHSLRPDHLPDNPLRRVRTDRPDPDRPADPHPLPPDYPARAIRMHSLPTASNRDSVSDAYIARYNTPPAPQPTHQPPPVARDPSLTDDDEHDHRDDPDHPHHHHHQHHHRDHHRNDADDTRHPPDVHQPHMAKRSISDLTDTRFLHPDRSATPSSPYVDQQNPPDPDDPADAWENVEYVLTDSYRHHPNNSPLDRDSNASPSHSRSTAWRLFSSIGTTLRRRPDPPDDLHQSTLGPASRYAHRMPKRRRALFARNNVRNGALWMEFTSALPAERMLSEVAKIAKAMGYQVWRRPGENKLRCIRRLSHRQEMHMVVLVGTIRLPEGHISVVRLRRARGDRNRTEAWRYAHFYRELVERLQRCGVEINAAE